MANPSNKALNIATAAVAVLGLVFLAVWIISGIPGPKQPETAPTQGIQTTLPDTPQAAPATQTAPPITNPARDSLLEHLPEEATRMLTEQAAKFTQAYTRRTWSDASPSSWLDRATPLATTSYGAKLKQLYGQGRGGLEWQEFVTTKSETAADIVETKIIRSDKFEQGNIQVLVTFDVQTLDGTGAVTVAALRYIKIVTLAREDGTWRAEGFNDVSGDPDYRPAR